MATGQPAHIGLVLYEYGYVVVHVGTDGCVVYQDWNGELVQLLFRPDARQEQELRRIDGATSQDDFFVSLDGVFLVSVVVFDARRHIAAWFLWFDEYLQAIGRRLRRWGLRLDILTLVTWALTATCRFGLTIAGLK